MTRNRAARLALAVCLVLAVGVLVGWAEAVWLSLAVGSLLLFARALVP